MKTPAQKEESDRRIDMAVDALAGYDPERIYLFGSFARNEDDELSDLDLVVIKKTTLPFFERMREAAKFLPFEIGSFDLFVYTPEEFSSMQKNGNAFIETLLEEGKVVYERANH